MDQPDAEFRQMAERSSDLLEWTVEKSGEFCDANRLIPVQVIAEFPRRLMWALYLQAVKYRGESTPVGCHVYEHSAIVSVSVGGLFLHASGRDVFRLSCPVIVRPDGRAVDDVRLERGVSRYWEMPPAFRQYDWPRRKSLITDAQRRLLRN